MFLKEIGLCAQNMLSFLGSLVNMIWGGGMDGDLTDSLKSTRMFDFDKGYAKQMNFI